MIELIATPKPTQDICGTLILPGSGVSATITVKKDDKIIHNWNICGMKYHGLSMFFPEEGTYEILVETKGNCTPSDKDIYYIELVPSFGLDAVYNVEVCVNKTYGIGCGGSNPPHISTLVRPGERIPVASGVVRRISVHITSPTITLPRLRIYKGNNVVYEGRVVYYPMNTDLDAVCAAELPEVTLTNLNTFYSSILSFVKIIGYVAVTSVIVKSKDPFTVAPVLLFALKTYDDVVSYIQQVWPLRVFQ